MGNEPSKESGAAGMENRNVNMNKSNPDQYKTFDELQEALRRNGVESSSLILGIDYTKSNTYNGKVSFGGRCLHDIDPAGQRQNPYQRVIATIGRTLKPFDDDNLIPAFGFGDLVTSDKSVFPLKAGSDPCRGFEEVLEMYNKITPRIVLSGPTNFAPIIREAIDHVMKTKAFHILVIIADGEVTNEQATAEAIRDASQYALSIVVVGVGDGPWGLMEHYDDHLPGRCFDNFQFVNFNSIVQRFRNEPDVAFATAALQEVPAQYKEIRKRGYLNF